MVRPGDQGASASSESSSGQEYSRFTFIEISKPGAGRDREKERSARSHAVSVALARQRHRAQKSGDIFRPAHFGQDGVRQSGAVTKFNAYEQGTPLSPNVAASSIDPFETLSVNAERLTALFHLKTSLRAGEPVFNINDAICYHSLYDVFESGLDDGALTASIGLAMTYAANEWKPNKESIEYSGIALRQIRQNLASPKHAVSAATIGSIVLLLGNEYRLGGYEQGRAHLEGIVTLLRLCNKQNVKLPDALKRAIYWQDMFSSIYLKTKRYLRYDFYPDRYDQSLYSSTALPPIGFTVQAERLGLDFMRTATKVAELYSCEVSRFSSDEDPWHLTDLGPIQADLEGELHTIWESTTDPLLVACSIALFMCVFALWHSVWNGNLIPGVLSKHLLQHLRLWQAEHPPEYDDEILLWLAYIGKAIARDDAVRNGFDIALDRRSRYVDKQVPLTWPDVLPILHKFVWSKAFYDEQAGWFWEHLEQ